jgi:hypothetical protein
MTVSTCNLAWNARASRIAFVSPRPEASEQSTGHRIIARRSGRFGTTAKTGLADLRVTFSVVVPSANWNGAATPRAPSMIRFASRLSAAAMISTNGLPRNRSGSGAATPALTSPARSFSRQVAMAASGGTSTPAGSMTCARTTAEPNFRANVPASATTRPLASSTSTATRMVFSNFMIQPPVGCNSSLLDAELA